MRFSLITFSLLLCMAVNAQTVLTIEKKTYTNYEDTWYGVNVPRTAPITFTFRNNSVTSVNRIGYLIEAGDEVPNSNSNNLDGETISGNVLTWNGSPTIGIIPHGIFTGYNINVKIKYNYLNRVPMAIVRKSNGMTDVSGSVAYNIIKDPGIGVVVKGMNGVRIYNNTFYNSLTAEQTNRALIDIYENPSVTPEGSSKGTKIFNNIFYTKNATKNISISAGSLTGFECDYNIYYCEAGTPTFAVGGSHKTFAQWQALGYDQHSVVINPNFKDYINFVPSTRLDYGTDLGTIFKDGLSVNARWGTADPETTAQNGKWQVGAIVYAAPLVANRPPVISISSPVKSTAFISPATITIEATASDPDGSISKVEFFNGNVKLGESSTPFLFTWKNVPEGTYSLTAVATDNLNLKTVSAGVSVVVEKSATVINQLPTVSISSPGNASSFVAPATVTLTSDASDSDGIVNKVEYFNGNIKIGESFSPPYQVAFKCTTTAEYNITAVATDNLNAVSSSSVLKLFFIVQKAYPDLIKLFPNPNIGRFSIDLSDSITDKDITVTITNLTGQTIYRDRLEEGVNTRQFDLSHFASGNYILMVTTGNRIVTTKKFIKN